MKVKLKDSVDCDYLSHDSEYEVIDEGVDSGFIIKDDTGEEDWFPEDYFDIVEESEEEPKALPLIMKFKADSLLDSLLIQKALFEAGYSWEGSGTNFREKEYSYIFTDDNKNIWTSSDNPTYKRHAGVPSTVESTLKIVEFVDNVQVEGYSVDRELLMEFLKKNGNEVSH